MCCRSNKNIKFQYYLALYFILFRGINSSIAGELTTIDATTPDGSENLSRPPVINMSATARTNLRNFVPIFTSDNVSYYMGSFPPLPQSAPPSSSSSSSTHRIHVPLMSANLDDTSATSNTETGGGGVLLNNRSTHADHSATYSIYDVVKNFDAQLKNIRNVELGVTIIQEIFDAMNFSTILHNNTQIVTKFAKRITLKLERAIATIGHLRAFFRDNMTSIADDEIFLNTIIHPCPPFEDISLEQTYNSKQIQILNYLRNSGHQYETDDANFTANSRIMEEMRMISGKSRHHLKNVYFLSRSDHASDHNCQYYFNDIHFRYLYVSAVRGKHMFLLIDHGSAFSSEQIELSKTFVTHILNLLSSSDSITIVTASDKVAPMELPNGGGQYELNVFPATMDIKYKIFEFINKLNRSSAVTNHTLGFEFSFDLLRRQNIPDGVPVQVLYITRGLLSHLTEGLSVLTTISRGQSRLNVPVRINTCAVVLDERRMMYEKQFLRDIAEQNYTKYGINVSDWYQKDFHDIRGNLFVVTKRHLERIIKTSTAVFENLFKDEYLAKGLQFHLPVIDYNTNDVIVSITEMIKPFGVIGVNMYLTDLAEDVIYFKGSEDIYAFLIDTNGTVLVHPAFSRPLETLRGHFPVDIYYLENCNDFKEIRRKIISDIDGNVTLNCGNSSSTYTWKRVLDAFIVCIVAKIRGGIGRQSVELSRIPVSIRHYHNMEIFSSDLLYHRIDLIPPQNPVCRHFRQIATLDSGTIFLSPSSFQSPFIYMRNNMERDEAKIHNAQSIMAYIKDITNLLANPGLQPQVRNDVSALYHVMSYLKKRHQESGALRKYIIRRYVATTNGVIKIYPGCILGTDLEPSRRPWYRKAMKYPGKIIATEPYLDDGGAGYIITIAHTIFEGKSNALHNADRDVPVAIVALDVPYAFFYKLLLDSSALCSESSIKCLLIEDEGYILAHPSILEPSTGTRNNRRPLEHITHKESFVANDILNHKSLVRKNVCAIYQNRTVNRYYRFNTTLNEILTNVAHGDRIKYQIMLIRGTNIFVALINSTSDGGAFCPCSTVDRTCLNCNRLDQTDCECPCECPLNIPDLYNDNDNDEGNKEHYKFCEPPIEAFKIVNSHNYDWGMDLKSCITITCDVYATQIDCLGIMGCEWCQLDIDGNQFGTPFCAPQSSCFNGVLGSVTPYGDGDVGPTIVEPSMPPAYSAIGPVGGAIIALCLVVGFAMYCYRQNLESTSEQFYADSIQDDNYGLPLSRFNFDDISPHDDSDLSGGGPMHRNLMQSIVGNAIQITDISPYHMSSGGYRRPNGESDHGYSTMTPHEDSEHMCFTLVEPLINNKRLSMSDSISINTSVSSPTNQATIPIDRPPTMHQHQQIVTTTPPPTHHNIGKGACLTDYIPGQTMIQLTDHTTTNLLSSPHHILAPVTVHRHMEAS